ncbi:MAG: hypothetical protein EB084_07605 [Proteobacteria bacterium]|nr:hypothetical protein [Pseudomonadota bacterium]
MDAPSGGTRTQPAKSDEQGSASRPTQDGGLVVGIMRVQRYPMSCVVWGYVYNRSGTKRDLETNFKLRTADGNLCQKATTQFQGQEYTVEHNGMLYFWPAFTWQGGGDDTAPQGYGNTSRSVQLGSLEVTVDGRKYVLPVTNDSTSLGPLSAIDASLASQIRARLGSYPDQYTGTQ